MTGSRILGCPIRRCCLAGAVAAPRTTAVPPGPGPGTGLCPAAGRRGVPRAAWPVAARGPPGRPRCCRHRRPPRRHAGGGRAEGAASPASSRGQGRGASKWGNGGAGRPVRWRRSECVAKSCICQNVGWGPLRVELQLGLRGSGCHVTNPWGGGGNNWSAEQTPAKIRPLKRHPSQKMFFY